MDAPVSFALCAFAPCTLYLYLLFSLQDPPVYEFGDPVTEDKPSRYSFYVRNEAAFPLHALAARTVLCVHNHSLTNERTHKTMGRIYSKYRNMSPASLEVLTLSRYFLTDAIKNDVELSKLVASGASADQLEAHFDGGMGLAAQGVADEAAQAGEAVRIGSESD